MDTQGKILQLSPRLGKVIHKFFSKIPVDTILVMYIIKKKDQKLYAHQNIYASLPKKMYAQGSNPYPFPSSATDGTLLQ